jgi:hypothetical protein
VKRLVRHAFELCAAVSLLLCVAAGVLWFRSYSASERLGWQNAGGWRWLSSRQGTITVELLFADWSRHPASWHGLPWARDRNWGSPRTPRGRPSDLSGGCPHRAARTPPNGFDCGQLMSTITSGTRTAASI